MCACTCGIPFPPAFHPCPSSCLLLLFSGVRLVVIDSIAALFRAEFSVEESALRAHVLFDVARSLKQLAHEHSAAVVCINQVSDRIVQEALTYARKRFIPALGLAWSSCVNTRFFVRRVTPRSEATAEVRVCVCVCVYVSVFLCFCVSVSPCCCIHCCPLLLLSSPFPLKTTVHVRSFSRALCPPLHALSSICASPFLPASHSSLAPS